MCFKSHNMDLLMLIQSPAVVIPMPMSLLLLFASILYLIVYHLLFPDPKIFSFSSYGLHERYYQQD